MDFKPNIVVFVCNWCSYAAADTAGLKRAKYPASIKLVRVMCTGRIDPQFILKAFKSGADGVMVLGCHPGDCHYKEGNYKAFKRYSLLKKVISDFNIADPRLFWTGSLHLKQINLLRWLIICIRKFRI